MLLVTRVPPPPAPDADCRAAVEGLLGAYVQAARGAFSSNTERAVKADLQIYTAWCAEQERAALPASSDTIAAFVDAMAVTRAPATVRRYVATVDRLSGHSTRVGAAQDMIAYGLELPAILQAGRWKSTSMVNRYGDRLLPQRSAAAQLARLQSRE